VRRASVSSGETFGIGEDNVVRQVRMARGGDVVLLEKPADSRSPKRTD